MTGSLDDWIAAAQQGDQQAFFQLYQMFNGRIYAICLRLCADRSQAEDATQEVFLKVWQQLPMFRGDSAFSTWLHPIACRTAVDIWRRNKVSRLCTEVDELPEIALPAEHPDAGLERAILRLPDQARAVFVLFALEGYQHQEIAQLLQIAVGTSKAQYHRARQLLMEWLDGQ